MYRLISVFFLLVCLGCSGGQRPEGFPALVPCSIQITQEGKALAGASVSLFPLDSANTWSSGGTTDESGTAQLSTHGKFSGVPVGKYKVVVQKQTTEGETGSAPMGLSPEEMAAFEKKRKENPPRTYDLVEPVFASQSTTTLEINVEKGGKNPITLEAGKVVRQEIKRLL